MIVPSPYEVNSVCGILIPTNPHLTTYPNLFGPNWTFTTLLSQLLCPHFTQSTTLSFLLLHDETYYFIISETKTSQWSHEYLLHGSNISPTFQVPRGNSWNHCRTLRYHYGRKLFTDILIDTTSCYLHAITNCRNHQ